MRCAGCAFNDWADRRYDAHVKRTASRPLVARRNRAVGGARRRRRACARWLSARRRSPPTEATVLLSFAALAHHARLSVLQAVLRAAAGVPRHRVLVRHPDGVRVGAGLRPGVRLVAPGHQPVLGDRLRHRVRDGRPRRRHQDRHAHVGHHVRPLTTSSPWPSATRCTSPGWRGWACACRWACCTGRALRVAVGDRGRIICGSSAPAIARNASAPSCTTTGWASRCSPRSRRISRWRYNAWPRVAVTRTLAALAGASFALRSIALPPAERVEFPSLDKDVTIQAIYFRPPASPADRPVPLVIAAHGCGGMYSESAARRDELSERSIAWTDMLLADGYAVLWPDSFNSRGRRSVCLVKRGEPSITPVTRRLDILGALAYAAAQPGIDRKRIALVGWSHGGSTTLAAVNGKDSRIADFFARRRRAASARRRGRVLSRLRRLAAQGRRVAAVGAASHPHGRARRLDAVASVRCARRPGASARRRHDASRSIPARTTASTRRAARPAVWKEVTTGVEPDKGVTLGPDPAARDAATQCGARVPEGATAMKQDMFAGRAVMVTGASKGIGFACAQAFAEAGATVAHRVAQPRESRRRAREARPACEACRRHRGGLDVMPSEAARAVDEAEAAIGPLDVLVNSAGSREALRARGARRAGVARRDGRQVLQLHLPDRHRGQAHGSARPRRDRQHHRHGRQGRAGPAPRRRVGQRRAHARDRRASPPCTGRRACA